MASHTLSLSNIAPLALIACAALAFGPGCGDDAAEDNGGTTSTNAGTTSTNSSTTSTNSSTTSTNSGTTTAPPEATFATYNVALARGFIDYATARTAPIAEAIAAIDADVVCLQEAWLYENADGTWSRDAIDTIIQTAAPTFPHHALYITEPEDGGASCTEDEITPLEECTRANCDGVANDQLSSCVLGNCSGEFTATSPACQGCLAANLGKSLDEIIEACEGGGASFGYDGHNGLLLLSKHPINSSTLAEFPSTLVYRSAIRANITLGDWGDADVYCTHLAADLSSTLAYPGTEFDSFEAEQAEQIRQLGAFVRAGSATPIVLGDMNTGAAGDGIQAEVERNYPLLLSETGLMSAYTDSDAPMCTYCASNTLVPDDAPSSLIDHILHPATLTPVRLSRFGDATATVSTEDGPIDMHLSDHFGISATFTR